MHVQVDLVADGNVGVLPPAVGEVVERKGDDAVRRVLKGHDAVGRLAGLDAVEDFLGEVSILQ